MVEATLMGGVHLRGGGKAGKVGSNKVRRHRPRWPANMNRKPGMEGRALPAPRIYVPRAAKSPENISLVRQLTDHTIQNGKKSPAKTKRRKNHAKSLATKITEMGDKLRSREFRRTASAADVKVMENKIADRVEELRQLESLIERTGSEVVEPSQGPHSDPSDDYKPIFEDQPVVRSRSKKRKVPEWDPNGEGESENEGEPVVRSRSKKRKVPEWDPNGEGESENEGDTNGTADAIEVIFIEDTPVKIKKEKTEKKDKKHKKRKVDKSSENSSQTLNSIAAFEQPENEQSVNNDNCSTKSKKPSSRNGNNGEDVSQNGSASPSPEEIRQAALLDTITRSRPRSDSPGDEIYEALVAGMLAQPSPPSPMSSIADYPKNPIDIGRSAIAAFILTSTQKPIKDRAFKAQVTIPAVAQKRDASSGHKESPILPPVRNFSSSRIVPPAWDNGAEKSKSKKKHTHGKEASHAKSNGNTNPEPTVEASQESITLSQTVTALKEAGSATVIEGIFAQANPFTSTKKILPTAKSHIPAAASFPNSINSSTPDVTPSRSKSKSKSRRERRIEGEAEDWEKASGRFRARIDKDGSADDREIEESK